MSAALRFCRIPRTVAVLAAAVALLAPAATAAGQATRGEIDACVRDNLIKYAPPDRAVIDQYLSIEAACEAALNGEPGAQISVAPVGGGAGDAGGASGGGGATTPSGGDTPTASDGTATAPASGSASGSAGARGAERGGAPGGGDAVVLRAAADLPAADAGSPAAVSAIGRAPWWMLAILVIVLAGVAWGIVMGARRRTR